MSAKRRAESVRSNEPCNLAAAQCTLLIYKWMEPRRTQANFPTTCN